MLSFGRYSGRAHAHHVFACFLIAALSCYLLREARDPSAPPRIDESEWVTAGYVAFSLVRQLAPVSRWQRAFDERELGDWGNKNPPLGKLIIGAAVAPLVSSDAAVNYQASMSVPPERHRLPPSELLVAARTSIALSAALLLLATYLLASELLGRSLWASVAPLCLFLVPNFQWHATHVYTDVPQLAFMSLGAYAMLRHARTRRFRWYALALVAGGLACAVKFSAAVFCVATAVYALPALLRRRSDVRPLLAAAIVPVAVFIAVNPYLHDRPIDKSIQLVRDWRATKRAQQADSLLASGAVQDRARGFELVLARGGFAPFSVPHLRSEIVYAVRQRGPELLGVSLVAALVLVLARVRVRLVAPPHRATALVAGAMAGAMVERALVHGFTAYGALCGAGIAALVLELRGPHAHVARAFALVLATNWLLTALWLPFDWSRYFLPNLTLASALYALGPFALARCFVWTRSAQVDVVVPEQRPAVRSLQPSTPSRAPS